MSTEPTLIHDGVAALLPYEPEAKSGDAESERPLGLHVSGIINDLCVRMGHYEGSEEWEWSEGDRVRLELGCAFEDIVVARYRRRFPDRYLRIGSVEEDQIWGTPDLVDVEEWAVEEIKLTWISSRWDWDSQKFWKYWVQLKAYCWILKSRVGRLHVCNVNGDYRYGKGVDGGKPVYRVWEWVWGQRELEENWEMLKRHGYENWDRLVERQR